MKIFYVCDRKKCDNCHKECTHTSDINHAKNFTGNKSYYEENTENLSNGNLTNRKDHIKTGNNARTLLIDEITDTIPVYVRQMMKKN